MCRPEHIGPEYKRSPELEVLHCGRADPGLQLDGLDRITDFDLHKLVEYRCFNQCPVNLFFSLKSL